MLIRSVPFRLLFITCFVVAAALSCSGERGASGSRVYDLLVASFPEQAARIVDADDAFAERDGGFSLPDEAGVPALRGGLEVRLPRRGDERIVIGAPGGLAIGVREIGAAGEGALAGSAVAYPRAGGTSLWTANEGGFEEWLLLDAGVARADRAAAAWEIEGAALRADGDAIAILDDAGEPRLRVSAPRAFAAGGRAVPVSLAIAGDRIELTVDAGGEAALVDPLWSSGGTLVTARASHASILLPSGKVLIAGGTGPAALASTELFDPAGNTWSAAAPMGHARISPTLTMLSTGKVLVERSTAVYVAQAELYDPANDAWSPGGTLATARGASTTTLLLDGRVLVAGGNTPAALASTEIYDPGNNAWSPAAPMAGARYGHVAARVTGGKVLVAGGFGANGVVATAELYNPANNTWAPAASLGTASGGSTATLLQNGKVIVIGGTAAGPGLTRAEIYDPASNTWTPAASMAAGRHTHTATLLPDGRVVVAGGQSTNNYLSSAEIYDPANDTWSPLPPMGAARSGHAATLLASGRVLVSGGTSGAAALATAQILSFGTVGDPCVNFTNCVSGFCADGVCCSTACADGPCDACSVAAGADVDGTCKLLTGNPCIDGNPCTQADSCMNGVCAGTPVVCPAADDCHTAGTCDVVSGQCSQPKKPDGTGCDDDDACTQSDSCSDGVCVGSDRVVCTASDNCHQVGVCDAVTGVCSDPVKTDGEDCDDGDLCTSVGTCVAGACIDEVPMVCPPDDECHEAGECAPATGMCSKPKKPDGTRCADGVCEDGACVSPDAGSGGNGGSGGEGGHSTSASGGGRGGESDEGCGCRAAGTAGADAGGVLAALAAAAVLARRRRRFNH